MKVELKRLLSTTGRLGLGFLLAAISAPAALAGEVYKSTDANGVTSFTDYPVPGAETVELEPVTVDPEQQLAGQAMIDQQLAVARALEESRLKRQQAETERLKALAAARPQTIFYPVEREITLWPHSGYGPWRPGYRPPGNRPPGFRPPGHRPPGHRPPGPSDPGRGDSISSPMPPAR